VVGIRLTWQTQGGRILSSTQGQREGRTYPHSSSLSVIIATLTGEHDESRLQRGMPPRRVTRATTGETSKRQASSYQHESAYLSMITSWLDLVPYGRALLEQGREGERRRVDHASPRCRFRVSSSCPKRPSSLLDGRNERHNQKAPVKTRDPQASASAKGMGMGKRSEKTYEPDGSVLASIHGLYGGEG
jgi:hypothetical protein